MTIKAQLKAFSPAGLSDALDAANVFSGACTQLTNLIPDPATRNLWKCRPAQTPITLFPGFPDAGVISAIKIVGDIVYGMIATSTFAGKDQPFSYNILAGTFNTITGATALNTPTSQPATGAWTPPVMELVGIRLIVTHPGFNPASGFMFGWIDVTDPTLPTWNAGNTTTFPLPDVASFVSNYQGSAAFSVLGTLYMTDPLELEVQSSSRLTFYDNTPIVATAGLGLDVQNGGIVQSLIVFKRNTAFQIKGSFFNSPSDISINAMPFGVGTQSPISVCDTPAGIALIAHDGLRFVDINANFSPAVGTCGDGVNIPFLNALVPSRTVAACNSSVFRVSVQNGGVAGTPTQEYWYHLNREPKIWSGPHTFPPGIIEDYGNRFITAPIDAPGALYISETIPSTVSVYEENGAQLLWTMTTTMFSDYGAQGVYNFNEMTINMAIDPTMVQWSVNIINPNLVVYDNVNNVVPNTAPYWDSAVWDEDFWDGIAQGLVPRRVAWSKDITTSRAQIVITGGSAAGVIIGETKYLQGSYQYVPSSGV